MKSIVNKVLVVIMLTGSITACTTANKTEEIKTGKEYTSAYICPMHCEGSGSDTAGLCPVCGMDYVENTTQNNQNTNI